MTDTEGGTEVDVEGAGGKAARAVGEVERSTQIERPAARVTHVGRYNRCAIGRALSLKGGNGEVACRFPSRGDGEVGPYTDPVDHGYSHW
jgi:hypothetical protein